MSWGVWTILPGLGAWSIALAVLMLRGKPREAWRKLGLEIFWMNSSAGELLTSILFFVGGALAVATGMAHL